MQEKPGLKYDAGKPRWDLLRWGVVEEGVKVLTHGAKKYADNSWKSVENGKQRYWGALLRHIVAIEKGELIDPESKLPHLGHVFCNIMFLHYFLEEESKTDMGEKK